MQVPGIPLVPLYGVKGSVAPEIAQAIGQTHLDFMLAPHLHIGDLNS